jgi:tRNA pseudouridine55 synthase
VPDQPGVYRAEVDCSSGTYVRTLADDLGHALGGGAHLRNLRRTAVGSFTLAEAHPLDQITVVPPAVALRDYPSVTVGLDLAAAVGLGRVLEAEELGVDGPGPWAVLDGSGALLAVYQAHKGTTVKPAVVLAPTGAG